MWNDIKTCYPIENGHINILNDAYEEEQTNNLKLFILFYFFLF